ncbi:MAG: TIM barrel protein [Deltaproteobacteria bacterium]|nr:TIM barrel protein [Deltaproteobacteria bacterium]
MSYVLGINTGFAVNRYSEPEEWARVVGDLGLRRVQLTADMLNPDLPGAHLRSQVQRIRAACDAAETEVTSTFTGAFTRVNHLAHPDEAVREHWIDWFCRFVDLSVDLGATSMGSHFGIFTHLDDKNPSRRAERRAQNIEGWHRIGEYAKEAGLAFLSWEPMSITREQGETLAACRALQDDVSRDAPLPFRICLDVDHGDLASPDPADTDPYAWLSSFAADSAFVHLKQSSANKGGHWPFTAAHNAEGRIDPDAVVRTLTEHGAPEDLELLLELSFREREPADSTVEEVLAESVAFWRGAVPA